MKIWELLGGLTVIVVLVFWIRWLLKPNASATWPENDWARASLLYAIPISLTLLGTTGVGTFAEHHGLPDALLLVLGIPMLFAVFIVGPAFLLTLFGVPMPPFLVPKWIRTQDREHRRLKRVARKRRWQDPQVKKSEISANVSGTLIAVGTVAVVLVVGIWSMSANGGS
ncbi:MAG TPA: hypothetical protein K8V32_07440 [Enteractinococcus helveticum]|uniref:Uncharacterized protein n=1 Tax=Enteractinococcus helveticum TaxID=1837282 RepID=A0A921FLY5_9MICC|nr:hypothetical protein [Enteractinococcus helveticum]HJF14625.1 hypothetical protein [Enteractinococcus helveticum]